MRRALRRRFTLAASLALIPMGLGLARTASQDPSAPSFQIDKSWPAPLPNDWVQGNLYASGGPLPVKFVPVRSAD